jgi:YD repeat-containing protein
VDSCDPDGDAVRFELRQAPAGMGIDASTRTIRWTPGSAQADVPVTVAAIDVPGGLAALQTFHLKVIDNQAPTITSTAPQAVTAGLVYRYDVRAADPEGDPVSYRLDQAPAGMTIDQFGRVRWDTTAGLIEGSPYPVRVTVTDPYGASFTQPFSVAVGPDEEPPKVFLQLGAARAALGTRVTFLVRAGDNVGVAWVLLRVTGLNYSRDVDLDANGVGSLLVDALGSFTVAAWASDAQGLTGSASASLEVIDPNDTRAPTLSMSSPTDGAAVTAPVDVVGSVQDDGTVRSWTLEVVSLDGEVLRTLGQGTAAVSSGVLGRFDPTLLENDSYLLRLTATDDGGNVATLERQVEVQGHLKLGNFSLSFTDLTVPVAGIPISVGRTYDTLQAGKSGDFGYGWRLDLGDVKLKVDLADGAEVGWGGLPAFLDGTRVYVTLPGGDRQGYTFRPVLVNSTFHLWAPVFVPDAGNFTALTVPDAQLMKDPDSGEYYSYDEAGIHTYNPADPAYGGVYQLVDPTGMTTTVDATTGRLRGIKDRRGDELTFGDDGIKTNRGVSVTFQRDPQGRITAIIDPAGKRVSYQYDAAGNLVAVTDRALATTRFTYRTDRPHYLDTVVDPLGRQAARTEYDAQGRVHRVFDAAGGAVIYDFDPDTGVQRITDQLGHTTTLTTDGRGNVVREEDPTGTVILSTYDSRDLLLSETQVVGQVDSPQNGEEDDLTSVYNYDARGNLVEARDQPGCGCQPRNITSWTYNDFGDVLTTTDSSGNTTTRRYDQNGELTASTDSNGNVTSAEYDQAGNLTSVRNGHGVTLASNSYDQHGDVTSTTPQAGRTTYQDYDGNGDQVATWYFDGLGATRVQVLDMTYFDSERRVIGTARVVLPDGQFVTSDLAHATFAPQYVKWTTSTTYNALGLVGAETDRFGLTTQYTYDLRNQPIQVRQQSADERGNTVWLVTRTVYDAAGRAVLSTDQYLEGTTEPVYGTRTSYDDAGRGTSSERLKGVVIGITGSGANLQSVVTTAGTAVSATTTSYDNAGRVILSTDSYGLQTRTSYTHTGEVVETRTQSLDENGQAVWLVRRTVYDELGRPVVQTDPYVEGSTSPVYATRTDYDDKGRAFRSIRLVGVQVDLVGDETVLSNPGTELWRTETQYDSQGREARSIAADGEVTDYEYDDLDRQVAVIGPPVVLAGVIVRQRTETVYDDLGRLSIERVNVRQYADGTIDRSQARETRYDYDASDNVVRTTYADGTFTTATYDDLGRKSSETNQLGLTRTFQYCEHACETDPLPIIRK